MINPPTTKEALRYYLPGMWTFRAFFSEPLRFKSGFLQGDEPPQWVEHYNSEPNTSPMVEEIGEMESSELQAIPFPLRAGLDDEDAMPMKLDLKQIYVERERGYKSSQKVRVTDEGLVVDFDVPYSGGYVPSKNRPEAYSTTWDIIASEDNLTGVNSHELRDVKKELSNFSVLRNPLVGNIFSSVEWGDFKIRRVATCVTRDNHVRIRFRFNGQPAVYADSFPPRELGSVSQKKY